MTRRPALPPRPRTAAGFTLLELMLAIAIFALVVAVLFSSFWAGINAWEKGEQRIEFQQRMRAVCSLLYREIGGAHPYRLTPSQLDKHKAIMAFFGEPGALRFVTYSNLHKRSSGLSMVELWVSDRQGLMIGDAAALASNLEDFDAVQLRSPERSLQVCPEVVGLQLSYYEKKPAATEDQKGEWVDRWDPEEHQGYLPQVVEAIVIFEDPRGERLEQKLVIPILSSMQTKQGGY